MRKVKTEPISVQCFPGITTGQLKRTVEYRELWNPGTILIHVGTKDLRRNENLVCVMSGVYDPANTAKTKLPKSEFILSGVLRRRDVSWRRTGALKDRFDWVAKALRDKFVDTKQLDRELGLR
jgi:hypothetical protein